MKVIINCQEYPDFELEKQILRQELNEVEIVESRTIDPIEFVKEAKGAVVAMVQYVPITPYVIDSLPECQGYVRNGIGYNNIDAEYAAKKGKYVANVPDYCIDEVSNHSLAMLLALNRKLVLTHNLVVQGNYKFKAICPINRLCDTTLGIVGMGRIGRQLSVKARALVKRIVYYDPCVPQHEFAEKVELDELCEISHNISLHVPLTPETENLINRGLLKKMRPDANIINTARGGTIDEKTLIDLLKKRKIAGAGIDVFKNEPIMKNSSFVKLDNVILSNHNAWYSEGALQEVKRSWTFQAVQIANGQRPKHIRNL